MDVNVQCFWIAISGVLTSATIWLASEEIVLHWTWIQLGYVLGHMAGSCVMTYCYTVSLLYISPVLVSLIICLSIVWLALAQYTFLANIHAGHQNIAEYCGIVLALIASTLSPIVILIKNKQHRLELDV